jgi:glucose-6-phosphate 1-epimerase
MELSSLRKRFGMPEALSFDQINGLVRVHMHTPQAKATVFFQGAHLVDWQPVGFGPVIFLSQKSDVETGKPLRGGVPVVFPWFGGDRRERAVRGPSHGFARIQTWDLASVKREHEEIVLVFHLGSTGASRDLGFDKFQLAMEFRVGRELTMRLTVTNLDDKPLVFEEGFHSYYAVADIHEVKVSGLEAVGYLDKVDHGTMKPAAGAPIEFKDQVDRVYADTTADCTIHDVAGRRRILVRKTGSQSTVVWNPYRELTDVGTWEWHGFVAVETANVVSNPVTLAAGASGTMEARVSVARATT